MLFRLSWDADILVLTGEAGQSLIKEQSALACCQSGAHVGSCHLEGGGRLFEPFYRVIMTRFYKASYYLCSDKLCANVQGIY